MNYSVSLHSLRLKELMISEKQKILEHNLIRQLSRRPWSVCILYNIVFYYYTACPSCNILLVLYK